MGMASAAPPAAIAVAGALVVLCYAITSVTLYSVYSNVKMYWEALKL
jgi:hypothetical protein